MTDVDAIVAGLSEGERRAILTGHCDHDTAMSPAMEPLWYAIRKVRPNWFRVTFRQIGLAVRARLEQADG